MEYARVLLRRLWITKGIRFGASRRLESKERAANLAIAILSIYVIAFALLDLLFKSDTNSLNWVPLVTIVAPVLILVLSQHETAKRHLVRSERLSRSARQVERLHSELEFLVSTAGLTKDAIEKVRQDYSVVLNDTSADHDEVDYLTCSPSLYHAK